MTPSELPPQPNHNNDLDRELNEFTIVFDGKQFAYPDRTPELSAIKGGAILQLVNKGEAPANLIVISTGLRVAVSGRILSDITQNWIAGLAVLAENVPGNGGSRRVAVKFPAHIPTGVYNYSILAVEHGVVVTDPCVIIK